MSNPSVSTSSFLLAVGIALVTILVLDGVWLGWLAKDFYQQELGPLMGDIKIVPAAVYYLLYPVAIVFLALTPPPASLAGAALRCAVLGVTAFGVYDMTNLSTLRSYSLKLALADMTWGTFATTAAGSAAYAFAIGRASA